MKQPSKKPPPNSVPRLNSLLHRLQHAPGQDDEPYLDQLMIFLDDPPPGIRDRWKEGAEMCNAWGIPCTGASVWRLYRSYAIVWRSRLALEASAEASETPEVLDQKAAQMIAFRSREILANPQSPPASLISLARIELRKKALEFAYKKHEDSQRSNIDQAYAALEHVARGNFEARFALDQFKLALKNPKPSPFFAALKT
jgi:hypothetical protein